jgi:hypothetical protein
MASVARYIAENLYQSLAPNSYGTWHTYEDAKVIVRFDTYASNVDVFIRPENAAPIKVLFWNGPGQYAQSYKPGRWEHYLTETLLPKAAGAARVREEERKVRERNMENTLFDPVDDSEVFP